MNLYQLLNECRRHSVTAQRYLFDHYAKSMFLVCRRYVRTDQVAEEMLMNGFLKFFSSLDRFQYHNEIATQSWLKKIMVNECLMWLRDQNSFLLVAQEEIEGEVIEEDITSRISAAEIFNLITQLPTGYRTIFNLYVLEDMSHKEIAEALGISEGTSKSQLSKARRLLQQLINKNNQEHGNRKTK